jgi:hypothetical protein
MSTPIRNRALAAFFAVTTGALVLIAAPAQAAPGGDPVQSCWLDSDTGIVRCFDDEAALTDAVAATGHVLVEERSALSARQPAGVLASFVIARFYDGGGYVGATWVVSSSSSTICTSGSVSGDFVGFNDRVSSFHSYFGCVTRIYQNTGGGGSFFGYVADAASVAPLDNQASSYNIT